MFRAKCVCAAFAVVAMMFLVSNVSANVILDSNWTFDGKLTDSSGNGYDGTLSSGTATYVSGKFGGQAISLSAGQSVDFASALATNLPTAGTASWSMNIWIQAKTVPELSYLAGFGDNASASTGSARGFVNFHNQDTAVDGTDGLYFWGDGKDVGLVSSHPYATADFHMLTATYEYVNSASVLTLYSDGVQLYQGGWAFNQPTNQTPATSPLANTTSKIHVNDTSLWGANASAVYQNFTIWSGVLSQGDVTSLYTTNSVVPEPSALALVVTGLLGLLCYAWRKRR